MPHDWSHDDFCRRCGISAHEAKDRAAFDCHGAERSVSEAEAEEMWKRGMGVIGISA